MRGLAALVVVLAVTSAAQATTPGRNGRIAFVDDQDRLLTMRGDGSGMRLRRARPTSWPAYSPDGARLAYVSGLGYSGVFVAPAGGGAARKVASFGRSPTWAPDGSRIAYIHGRDAVEIVDLAGHVLASYSWPQLYEIESLEWSPDGRSLAFTGSEAGIRDACCIYVVRASGDGLRRVVRAPAPGNAWHPRWSPDGTTIAFTEYDSCRASACSGPHRAVTIRRNGTGRRIVAEQAWAGPWSPDGRLLLVQHYQPDVRLDLVRMRDGATTLSQPGLRTHRASWQGLCTQPGTPRGDALRAGPSGDVVCGLAGNDILRGGRAADRIFGGAGDDLLTARGGGRDIVGCGAGGDIVVADRFDVVGVDCERRR